MFCLNTESTTMDNREIEEDFNSKYVVRCKCNVILMCDKQTQCNFYESNENSTDGLTLLDENVYSEEHNDNYKIFVEPLTADNFNMDAFEDLENISKLSNERKCDSTSRNFETDSISDLGINDDDLFAIVPEYKYIKVDSGYMCEICSKISPNKAAYISHHELHEERCNLCYACGYSAENYRKLRLHVYFYETHGRCRNHDIVKKVENCCEICNKTFSQYIRLMDHINTHTKDRPYRCGCGSCFGCHSNLMTHLRKFKCSPEGRSIPSYAPSSLLGLAPLDGKNKRNRRTTIELNKIVDDMKINLPLTSRKIINEKIIKNKQRKHVTNGQYICEECTKEFSSAPKLRIHRENEHMERKFTCDICKRKFAKECLLRVHIGLFHVKKYKCEECNLVFPKIAHKTHMQTHNAIRVKCEECGMLMKTRYFREHMEKHTSKNQGDSTFYCAICKLECQFKFYREHLTSPYHLKFENEIKNKFNIRKFSCRRCDKKEFDNICDYTKHHGVYHCWSVKKQLEDILKLFDNFKKFDKPTVFEM